MSSLVQLIIFIILVAVCWWALKTVLPLLGFPSNVDTIIVVLFVVIAVLAAANYLWSGGNWFWRRP